MADDAQTPHSLHPQHEHSGQIVRSIHWREVFPFLHLFRAFRIAVHPSKLVLGLLGLLTLYAGGRILDGFWPGASQANYGEATRYEQFTMSGGDRAALFQDQIDLDRRENQRSYSRLLSDGGIAAAGTVADAEAQTFSRAGDLKDKIVDRRNAALAQADKALEDAYKKADAETEPAARDRAKREARDVHTAVVASSMLQARDDEQALRVLRPRGIFDEFFAYQTFQVDSIVHNVLANNWTGGLGMAQQENAELARLARQAGVAGFGRDTRASGIPAVPASGVLPAVVNFFVTGPGWLVRYHYVYFILFFTLFLLVWAVFGGAISRIAAVHAARDEKISVRQALRFSTNKVLSFVFAPVIPLGIVLFIGLALALGGLLFYIPWLGPGLAGALMILALIGGVLITLVLIGTVGGLNLMYPTVAAEGSDSFDAISRSFSYVYARPWRMLFYTAVAVAYGAVTYLFVKLFIYMVLAVTHYFVGWWLIASPGRWYPEIWPSPSFGSLPYVVNWTGLKFTEKVAAALICFWNYLLIGLLGAFAISFYFSVNTIIYYLMRREVDATELDDVYLEEADDDLSDPMPGPVTGDGPSTAVVAPSTPISVAASEINLREPSGAPAHEPNEPTSASAPQSAGPDAGVVGMPGAGETGGESAPSQG